MDLVSCIAGLIGLASLVLESASFLYKYCSKYKNLAGEIEPVVQDIKRLQDLLQHIERTNRDALMISSQHPKALMELELEIKACETDLNTWFQALQQLQQTNNRSSKNIIENLKAAANQGRFTEMRAKIASHRQQLDMRLSHMNMSLDIHTHRLHQQAHASIMAVKMDQDAFHQENNNHLTKIQENIDNLHATEQNTLRHINDGFQQVVSCNRIESTTMLNHIDASLQNIQQQILSSMPATYKRKLVRRPRGRPLKTLLASTSSAATKDVPAQDAIIKEEVTLQCTTYLMRVVKPGLLITESKGQLHRKLVAVPVYEYDESSLSEKRYFVQQIQGLRVLIWLLKNDPYIPVHALYGAKDSSSELLLQGTLNCTMEIKEMIEAVMQGVQGLMDRSTLIFLAERYWIWGDILIRIIGKMPAIPVSTGLLYDGIRRLGGEDVSKSAQLFSQWLALYQSPKPPITLFS